MMNRIQSFEFNERRETPWFVRDAITEILGRVWRILQPLNPTGAVFADFCRRARCKTILDLASGTGEPVSLLIDGLNREGISSVRFVLSDLFPKPQAMRRVALRYRGQIDVMDKPIDATDVPFDLDCDACTIVGAFHHFPPGIARQILADCVEKRRAVFILDVSRRSLISFLLLFPIPGIIALLLNPFLAGRDRILKSVFTFFLPAIPLLASWDLVMTALRTYSEKDYSSMTRNLKANFEWEYRDVEFLPGAMVAVFSGIPV